MHPTPLKSIRLKCLDCSGGLRKEVKLCPIKDCPLYPFRMGKNPNRKGCGSGAGLKAFREKTSVEWEETDLERESDNAGTD